jgi:hypothetical protein
MLTAVSILYMREAHGVVFEKSIELVRQLRL